MDSIQSRRIPKIPDSTKSEVIRLYTEEPVMSIDAIAERTGISPRSVNNIIAAAKIAAAKRKGENPDSH